MCPEPFDEFSKALASGVSRRTAMKALVVSVAGGVLALFGASSGEAARACREIGKPCRTDADCCDAGVSSFCYGKRTGPPNDKRCTSCLPVGAPIPDGSCLSGFEFCCSRVIHCDPTPHCAAPA